MSTDGLALLRLCQLVSPALPIGAFNFSQGLELAIERDWVRDEASVHAWISGCGAHAVATLDLPLLLRMHRAWREDAEDLVLSLSRRLLAARETAELRAEELHMGRALAKVLLELQVAHAGRWLQRDDATYAAMFALAAVHGGIDEATAAHGYLWAWCENQVLASVKLLPLGQSAGQRILNQLLPQIPPLAAAAAQLDDDDVGIATPLQAMASAWHETQYTRLFRS